MSVVELIKHPEVCKLLDSVTPLFSRQISAPIIMPPMTNRYSLVGTAFDYAVRFELERLNSHACTERWVSEIAITCTRGIHRKTAQRILDAAKADFEDYVKNPNPSIAMRTTMAAHAIRLAKLDVIYRAGYTDPAMDVADSDDVRDVLQLLAAAPYSTLAHPTTIYLNPTFGHYSLMVGGADCDIISGDALIDIKVTKDAKINARYVRQLLSYIILARGARKEDKTFPEIRSIGVYFARHAHLWTLPINSITDNPQFLAVEAAYLDYAQNIYGIPIERPRTPVPRKRKKMFAGKKVALKSTLKRTRVKRRGKTLASISHDLRK